MFKRLWHYLINTFLNVTRSNYKKALILGVDHEAKLQSHQADPVIMAMLATFSPVLQAYKATDVNLRIALGDYKGETQTVEELFELVNKTLLDDWELGVYSKFRKGTPEATALLPQGRKPFQSGTYESRIQEIKALGDKCAAIPDLEPLSVTILAFHTQIESARQLQQTGGEAQVANLRLLREQARVSLCEAMFGNLGLLMNHHKTNPADVSVYFELPLLRSKRRKLRPVMGSGTVVNALTGEVVPQAHIKFMLPNNVVVTTESDENGDFEVELGTFTSTTDISLEVTAENYQPFNESGQVDPNEDIDVDVDLEPMPAPGPSS